MSKIKSYLNDKTCLIYDFGLCLEIGLKLAEKFEKVFYYTPWAEGFPSSDKAMIGEGFRDDGLIRVNNFWEYVDEVDLICFFDTYTQDIAEYLIKKGYNVFAPGFAEYLERDRYFGRKIQQQVGLDTQKSELIKGVDNLKEYLKSNQNVFVKINTFRGDIETFFAKDLKSVENYLDFLSYKLGVRKNDIEFLVEEQIEGIEPGYDGFVIDGKYPNYGFFAYEIKGTGYIARCDKYGDLPKQVTIINDKLSNFFKKYRTRSMFSTECIVTKGGKSYLIDPTIRAGMPLPSACELEAYNNFAEFIYEGAKGNLINLEPVARYFGGIALDSEWANEHWLEVNINEEIRSHIKFRRVMKKENGLYYAIPGFSSICSVIGWGNTIDDVINQVKDCLNGVSAFELQKNLGGLVKVKETIQDGIKNYNLEF